MCWQFIVGHSDALKLLGDLKANQMVSVIIMQAKHRVVGKIAHQLATKHEIWQYSKSILILSSSQ